MSYYQKYLLKLKQCIGLWIFLIVLFVNISVTNTEYNYVKLSELFPNPSANIQNKDWLSVDSNTGEHPCKRECRSNESATCYYYFVVHNDEVGGEPSGCNKYLNDSNRITDLGDKDNAPYYMLPSYDRTRVSEDDQQSHCNYADGVRSKAMLVNSQLPGPQIEICERDTVTVDVVNIMQHSTTMHWHGIQQLKTPHMDGVPHVSQYPIMPGQAYRYRFEVDQAGTHWWHSHTEHQRAFGLAGVLIVRQPQNENVHANAYDYDLLEHTILLQDWVHNLQAVVPQNILINGLGADAQQKEPHGANVYAQFSVEEGFRYRFRIILNGISSCPMGISIDNHDMIVIASDGNDIEPVRVQKIELQGGERYDFVLHANQPVANYWIRVKGYGTCQSRALHQAAVLSYKNADEPLNKPEGDLSYEFEPTGTVLNPIDGAPDESQNQLTVMDLRAKSLKPEVTYDGPVHTFYTSMSIFWRDNEWRFQMDEISYRAPTISFLQTRNLGISGIFCNSSSLAEQGKDCTVEKCICSNVIQVPAFSLVELVIASYTDVSHPIHLHGYTFKVVGMGKLGKDRIQKIAEIDKQTPLARRTDAAPLKDSVQVPPLGYTIIQFYTDNPGYWMFHCHISTHSENGMAAVLRVGNDAQMRHCPLSNCGLCNSEI